MSNKTNYGDIDEDTNDDINMFQTDLENINVNVWFNKLESRLQYCLVKDNVKEGFLQFKLLVRYAEVLGLASGKIDKELYDKDVKELRKNAVDDYQEVAIKDMQEAMIKYQAIIKQLLKPKKSDLSLSY